MRYNVINILLMLWCKAVLSDPLLVVVLMVKNESRVIEATLQPFIDSGVRDFVIFDTGSTDGTQDIAINFFQKHGIENGHIVEEDFIDFATSRNHALESVHNLFPDAIFMLMPDAEWYMHNAKDLLQFCQIHMNDSYASYLVLIKNEFIFFYTNRLIRCHKGIKFVGRVHETLNEISIISVPDTIYFEWHPSQDGNKKSQKRWIRDRDALLESHQENPSDLRTLFYLAQTYECLEDWQNAYKYYTKRATYKGWCEEDFTTYYRLGRVAHELNQEEMNTHIPIAVQYYLHAFSLCPHRAEPLVKIAEYYIGYGDMHSAFLYAARAVQLPYPSRDILFVETYVYDFVRYDVLGICAWYVGEYELGEQAVLQALKREPTCERLHYNLQLYRDSKKLQEHIDKDKFLHTRLM